MSYNWRGRKDFLCNLSIKARCKEEITLNVFYGGHKIENELDMLFLFLYVIRIRRHKNIKRS